MLQSVRISSFGCTWDVWRALKKLELLSAAPRATLTPLVESPNFSRASITRYTHAKHDFFDFGHQLNYIFVVIILLQSAPVITNEVLSLLSFKQTM